MYLDILFLLTIFFFSIIGFFRGLINQLFSLIALIVCILWGRSLHAFLSAKMDLTWPPAMGILVTMMFTYFAIILSGYGIDKLVASRGGIRGNWNPILGSIFGSIKAICIAVIAIYLLTLVPEKVMSALPSVQQELEKSTVASILNSSKVFDLVWDQIDPLISEFAVGKPADPFDAPGLKEDVPRLASGNTEPAPGLEPAEKIKPDSIPQKPAAEKDILEDDAP